MRVVSHGVVYFPGDVDVQRVLNLMRDYCSARLMVLKDTREVLPTSRNQVRRERAKSE